MKFTTAQTRVQTESAAGVSMRLPDMFTPGNTDSFFVERKSLPRLPANHHLRRKPEDNLWEYRTQYQGHDYETYKGNHSADYVAHRDM